MGEPMPQAAVFRDLMIDEKGVHAGLADHEGFALLVVVVQPEDACLVGFKFTGRSVIEGVTHHSTKIGGAEPDLGVEQQGVDKSVVAGEGGRFEVLCHDVALVLIP